jgi:hypothetical protein
VALSSAAGLLSLSPLYAAADQVAPSAPHGRVIVVLHAQTTSGGDGLPATTRAPRQAARAQQGQVAASIERNGGTVRDRFELINALSATVTASEAVDLANDSRVAAVVPDATIREAASDSRAGRPRDFPTTGSMQTPHPPVAGACPSHQNDVAVGPEALTATHADSAHSLGYTGKGVTVGFIADGVDIHDPDLTRDGKSVFSDYQDFSGDGPDAPTGGDEAFLDAGAIAAQGTQVHDLARFSNLPLSRPCLIRLVGEAPGVDLVGLKVFSDSSTTTSNFLQAIDYAADVARVDVLNESFGGNPLPDTTQDLVKAANTAAIARGVTVTVSTGDAGITNTIGSPATAPGAIAVGASTTFQAYLQTGYHGATLPGINGWVNNNISSLSSAGFSSSGRSVDLVAPGDINFAPCSTDLDTYPECTTFAGGSDGIEEAGGTSESAPIVAGVAALAIQAYRAGHHGSSPAPALVKRILLDSADDIGAPAEQQGAGLVNARRAVVLAKAYGSTGAPTATAIQLTKNHFTAIGHGGQLSTFKAKVRNVGAKKATMSFRGRTLGAYTSVADTTVTLGDSGTPYVDYAGLADNVAKTTFAVPAKADRLQASIAYQGSSLDPAARDRLLLVDPRGRLAGTSLPQGVGNYGHTEVARPLAGTWTAYVLSRTTANGGSAGAVRFAASVASYRSFGSVSPGKVTLAPGKSATMTLKVKNPAKPGDTSGALLIASSVAGAHKPRTTSTVPVILRTLIPGGSHSFAAALTGGNGRNSNTGTGYSYQTDVAANTPSLNVRVTLPMNSKNPFNAFLVAPSGNVVSQASNATNPGDSNPLQPTTVAGVQLHAVAPPPGRWTILVDFTPAVSGMDITTPFVVATDNTPLHLTSTGVPTSTATVINTGAGQEATITITNNGPTYETFFVDPRLSTMKTYDLLAIGSAQTNVPPGEDDEVPAYLIPTNTTSVTAAATTTGGKPFQFDVAPALGDPDLASSAGLTPSATYTAQPVTPGLWAMVPSQIGPYPGPPAPEPVSTTMTATTRAFDPSAIPSTGDLWGLSVASEIPFEPVDIAPHSTGTITVHFQPPPGQAVVSGTLYVDTFSTTISLDGTYTYYFGNQAAALPYRYTAN